MAALSLSPQVFAILCALVEEKLGIHYSPAERTILADKIGARALEAGFESLLDYYYFLRYGPGSDAEMDALTDALVVNETYFFRELDPLRVIVQDILAPRVQSGRRPRVWSAACSTGEEPLSLCMLLADREMLGHVDVVATDISNRALTRARSGRHSKRSLRSEVPDRLAERFLTHQDDGVVVAKEILAAVKWKRLNLMDQPAIAALGKFDVVLCRNVLIYFAEPTSARVVQSLSQALTPDGTLVVGVAESLMRFGTTLHCQEHKGVFLYSKQA